MPQINLALTVIIGLLSVLIPIELYQVKLIYSKTSDNEDNISMVSNKFNNLIRYLKRIDDVPDPDIEKIEG